MWTIRRNKKGDNFLTEVATITKGNCCWTITGTNNQEKRLKPRNNPKEQIDFFIKELGVMECS